MLTYAKKQQKFITDLYGHDLGRFEERVESLLMFCEGYDEHDPAFKTIFRYSRELIRGDTKNLNELFDLAKSVQEKLQDKSNVFSEQYDNGDLTAENSEEDDRLWMVLDSLRILINLHPDRILTWDEVQPVDWVVYPK